ncbi:MAG: hypothetical protein C0624_07855 [Desulfuromonas sp.]|nr:MAG: hypothetical protein C0624_07855 [Desulfuromonas sp.]
MFKKWICLLLLVLMTSGCARQAMMFSFPPGAEVSINGEQVGFTPCRYDYNLSSGDSYQVMVTKPGYKTTETKVVANQNDKKARNSWLAAGLVWSPLWLGTLFTKRLQESYLFNLKQDSASLTAFHP